MGKIEFTQDLQKIADQLNQMNEASGGALRPGNALGDLSSLFTRVGGGGHFVPNEQTITSNAGVINPDYQSVLIEPITGMEVK